MQHKQTCLEHRDRLTDTEGRLAAAQGQGLGRRTEWGVGVSRCKQLHAGERNSKVLKCSTENYIQYHDKPQWKKRHTKMYLSIYLSIYIYKLNV